MNRVDIGERSQERERRVFERWKKNNTFQASIEKNKDKPRFVFYDGPPTANGMPHIGHVLGRVLKDAICRYKNMQGHSVLRKAGWDTHGMPVELGVEKEIGISGKQQIEEYGIERFINKCKESVFRYEREWRKLTDEIGYWTDLESPYITLNNKYIEQVWKILSDLHSRGLLYQGHRVSPYCPSCQTSLSSHEVAQGYENVKDLSAVVKFQSLDSDNIFLAWTTTPWTLPANAALAMNPKLTYARVLYNNQKYIMAKSLVEKVMPEGSEYQVLSEHAGLEFEGERYKPLFDFVVPDKGHYVIAADFVSEISGTGIVHIAPAYGEDDYNISRKLGITLLHVVDRAGKYIEEVTPWSGRLVKECDVDIIKDLAKRDLLFHKERIEHSYPFCWRCKSPLLYYAMQSWFVKTTSVKDQMIANNKKVTWYPEHIRDGRFGNFLEDLVDWNISRNRYWGTPLNVWLCENDSCRAEYSPSSLADLRSRAVEKFDELELHRPYVDDVRVACHKCSSEMSRTSEVIDCWFDSGSMPFAQYAQDSNFEQMLKEQFPADMICEGIDQTRGWFFSLLAISTLYKQDISYKSVLSTGHILDEQGRKMSKSAGNVIDPNSILSQYGADAFRWALLVDSAPWNTKRFSVQIVAEAKSKVIDTLNNTHAFFVMYAQIDGYKPDQFAKQTSRNVLDRWILSRLQSLILDIEAGMSTNNFSHPTKDIQSFIDEMSNWYVRRSRDRFWSPGLAEDKINAYNTLHHVLVTLSRIIAPFAPFIADEIYNNLVGGESVHLTEYPKADESKIDTKLEADMGFVRKVVELGRSVRNDVGIKIRQPLSELIVLSSSGSEQLEEYKGIISDELNIKNIRLQNYDNNQWLVTSLRVNLQSVGPKYGKHLKSIMKHLENNHDRAASELAQHEKVLFALEDGTSVTLEREDFLVDKQAKEGFASAVSGDIAVVLNTDLTEELIQEGFVREVIRSIQNYRKELDLAIEDRISLALDTDPASRAAIQKYENLLTENVLLNRLEFSSLSESEPKISKVDIGDKSIKMVLK